MHSDGSSDGPVGFLQQHGLDLWHNLAPGPAQKAKPSLPPIQALLQRLKPIMRVYLEPEEANSALAHLVAAALVAHPRLEAELVRYGWQQGFFKQALDVQGLTAALKKFKYERQVTQLGSGSYGVVFKARDIETMELLAIKKLAAKYEDDCGLPDSTLREITTLRELRHPNIVQ